MIRIILSWVPISREGLLEQIRGFVYDITEPYLNLFRRALPMVNLGGVGFDLSPIIGLIILGIIHRVVVDILLQVLV